MHLLCRGSGPPILFIHGMPTSNQLWSGIIERLCGNFTCFAIDLPGLGNTPREPYGPDYLPLLAKRLDALRIENKVDKWHVVGHRCGLGGRRPMRARISAARRTLWKVAMRRQVPLGRG